MYKFLGNYDFDFTINLQDFKFRDNKVNHYDDSFYLESKEAIKAVYCENKNCANKRLARVIIFFIRII